VLSFSSAVVGENTCTDAAPGSFCEASSTSILARYCRFEAKLPKSLLASIRHNTASGTVAALPAK
jgi:hypothetical protein